MSENWKIQISPKLTDGTLVNLRAENPDEAEKILEWAIANAAKIGDAVKAVNAVSVVGAAFPGAQVQVEQAAPPAAAGWNTSAATQPPAFAQQTQQQYAQAATAGAPAPAAAGGAAPQFCSHGAMTYREGQGAKGPWKAYFCPTPKGTPNQCQAQFIR